MFRLLAKLYFVKRTNIKSEYQKTIQKWWFYTISLIVFFSKKVKLLKKVKGSMIYLCLLDYRKEVIFISLHELLAHSIWQVK